MTSISRRQVISLQMQQNVISLYGRGRAMPFTITCCCQVSGVRIPIHQACSAAEGTSWSCSLAIS